MRLREQKAKGYVVITLSSLPAGVALIQCVISFLKDREKKDGEGREREEGDSQVN